MELYICSVKIIIADSNDVFRIGLRTILCSQSNFEIIGEAKTSAELFEQINNFDVDVILIDYTSTNFSIDVVPKLLSSKKNIGVVAITPDQSAQTVVDALRSGVTSHIKKDCDSLEIINSVSETANGNKFFCGQILETIRKASIDVNDIDFESFTCEPISLSEREMEILKLIAEGHTNVVIAEMLHLSTHTINTHRKNIMAKLGVKNTAGIVMYAVKTNLVSPNKFLFAAEN